MTEPASNPDQALSTSISTPREIVHSFTPATNTGRRTMMTSDVSEIGLFDAMYSARALRRLKPDPVPEDIITKVLDAAIRAPSGGNAQNWIFIVVRDEAQRHRLGAVYRKASDEVAEIYAARGRPPHLTEDQYHRLMAGGAYLWDHIGDAPVLLVPCLRQRDMPPKEALPAAVAARYEAHLRYQERIRGSSIYPAVQNIILACRGLGLGTLITTNHILYEDDVRAILGLPDDVFSFALMPIGFPVGRYGPLARRPVSEVTFADRWGEKWPG
jgi:nitroreductase